jgi:hypothetical protein
MVTAVCGCGLSQVRAERQPADTLILNSLDAFERRHRYQEEFAVFSRGRIWMRPPNQLYPDKKDLGSYQM